MTLTGRAALVTTQGDEVQVTLTDEALESLRHERTGKAKRGSPFAKSAKGRPPKKVLIINEW